MTLINHVRGMVLAGLAAISVTAFAAYPERQVTLLVGYAPGGATDIIARTLATNLSSKWGQTVVVENKPGASGMLAAEQVVRAKPDGYTLLLGYTPEVSLNKLVFKKMRYDPIADLTPIVLTAEAPLVLVAGPKLSVATMQELLAKKNSPQPLTYGSPGTGGQQHLAGEMLARSTGLALTHVPYKGTALAVNDLLGGHIDLFFGTAPPLLPHIRAGKLRPIAVAGNAREKLLPDVPTVVELGIPRLQLTNWFGVFAPKGVSEAVLDQITNDVAQALADTKVVKTLEEQGLSIKPLRGAAFRDFIDSEMKKYQAIVTETGVSVDQ
jgi:tripartite-type tricarboxylate transporter receptor subunit TctC